MKTGNKPLGKPVEIHWLEFQLQNSLYRDEIKAGRWPMIPTKNTFFSPVHWMETGLISFDYKNKECHIIWVIKRHRRRKSNMTLVQLMEKIKKFHPDMEIIFSMPGESQQRMLRIMGWEEDPNRELIWIRKQDK